MRCPLAHTQRREVSTPAGAPCYPVCDKPSHERHAPHQTPHAAHPPFDLRRKARRRGRQGLAHQKAAPHAQARWPHADVRPAAARTAGREPLQRRAHDGVDGEELHQGSPAARHEHRVRQRAAVGPHRHAHARPERQQLPEAREVGVMEDLGGRHRMRLGLFQPRWPSAAQPKRAKRLSL